MYWKLQEKGGKKRRRLRLGLAFSSFNLIISFLYTGVDKKKLQSEGMDKGNQTKENTLSGADFLFPLFKLNIYYTTI
jgi:hypothetical protein